MAEENHNTQAKSATLHNADGLWILASVTDDGVLRVEGHDLNPPESFGDEYEYFIDVAAEDVPRVVAALGGSAGDDVLALLLTSGIGLGFTRWLQEHGVSYGFSSWY